MRNKVIRIVACSAFLVALISTPEVNAAEEGYDCHILSWWETTTPTPPPPDFLMEIQGTMHGCYA